MKRCAYVLYIVLLYGCIHDFNPNGVFLNSFEKKIVINSLLCPDSCISIRINWSQKFGDSSPFSAVTQGYLKLYENDVLVYHDSIRGEVVRTLHRAQGGHKYRVIVTVPHQNEVCAETVIPEKADFNVIYLRNNTNYTVFKMTDIFVNSNVKAVWIVCLVNYADSTFVQSDELYADNPFLDPINSSLEQMDVADRESSILFERFIRIRTSMLRNALPVQFSIRNPGDKSVYPEDNGKPVITKMTDLSVVLITPSPEYDAYFRSGYKQYMYSNSTDNPLLYEPVSVYSNVKNGLGIFAGYSSNEKDFPKLQFEPDESS